METVLIENRYAACQSETDIPCTIENQIVKDPWDGLEPHEIATVQSGHPIVRSELFHDTTQDDEQTKVLMRAAFTVGMPIELVWQWIGRVELLCRYLPRLESSPVAWRQDDKVAVDFTVTLWELSMFGLDLSFRIHYRVLHRNFVDEKRLFFWLDKSVSSDVDMLEGYWKAFSLTDNRTLLRYQARVNLKWFLPLWVQSVLLHQEFPAAVEAAIRFIESDGNMIKSQLGVGCQ
ncbi:MAG: hypothetical protein OJF52_000462 [Nitrospira sp.]|jgi:ligand-binding SRPBCC domain-containing protein|nr:MAG: hypothetical protein OJF52_000462 [Nitrospira sp.]